jgi:hypothetical protein
MRFSDGVLDFVGNCNLSLTQNALKELQFSQNFHWIFCHCGAGFESFGLLICNRAFSQITYRYTKRIALRLEKTQRHLRSKSPSMNRIGMV